MNSGMETVSISTKSALPNSRLSCSAMAPANGLRWAPPGSGGRAGVAGAGPGARGELGRGRGGAAGWGIRGRGRRAPLGGSGPDRGRPAAPRRALGPRGAPGSFRFSRGGCLALWGTGQRDGDGGGWSRLWPGSGHGPAAWRPAPPRLLGLRLAPPRPAAEIPPRGGAGLRLLTWAARSRGAGGGGARGAGLGAGRQRPLGTAAGTSRGGAEECGRRSVGGIKCPGWRPLALAG